MAGLIECAHLRCVLFVPIRIAVFAQYASELLDVRMMLNLGN